MRLAEAAAVGRAYGASLLSFLVDGTPRPFSATFALTNRCNLRCEYCNYPYLNPKDLDFEQVDVILRRLQAMGVRRLGLAGGEPMLRKDFGHIIERGKELGFFVAVNTNLTLYERFSERLKSVDLVYTSLDGDADAHRAARGSKAYDGVLEAIVDLLQARIPVIAICVVTEHSVDQAEHLLQQAERMGFRVHFQPQCTDTTIVRGHVPDTVSNERWRAFWRGLLEQKKKGRPILSSTSYLRFLAEWGDFAVSAIYDATQKCAAGRGFLYIDPHGDAYACPYVKGKAEPINLLTNDWREAWNRQTPCTRCMVGPMLEFNLLFQRPMASALEAARSYW